MLKSPPSIMLRPTYCSNAENKNSPKCFCSEALSIVGLFVCLFGVLRRFQHCTGHITTGSWKGRGNQYIEFARVVYCKLLTNGKQLPAFPLEPVRGSNPGLRGGKRECYHSATVAPLSIVGAYILPMMYLVSYILLSNNKKRPISSLLMSNITIGSSLDTSMATPLAFDSPCEKKMLPSQCWFQLNSEAMVAWHSCKRNIPEPFVFSQKRIVHSFFHVT